MNIAFLVYHWPVISETFILNQITWLLDQGHEVDVHAKTPGKEPLIHQDMERYDLLARTFYYKMPSQRLVDNRFVRVVKAVGLFVTHVHKNPKPMLRSLDVFRFGRRASSLGLFYKIVPFLDKDMKKYDIVHCHFGPNGNLAVLLKDLGLIEGKIVTTFHGEAGYTGKKRYEKGFGPVFEGGDAILPMSEKEKQDLVKLGCDPRKIVVHRMGVDLEKFVYAPRRPRRDGTVNLLTVARLDYKKGLQYGIPAVAQVIEKHPDLVYRIVGDGPLKEQLEDLVAALGVGDRVKLLGWKRQEEVIELTKAADIFLAPSVTAADGDQEGIPVALMEAMARGLPVISTRHAGIPELVQDGVSGLLVPEGDTDTLAEKIEYLIQRPELWPEMGRAGRLFVEQNHDINKLNDQLVQLYRRLLDEGSL